MRLRGTEAAWAWTAVGLVVIATFASAVEPGKPSKTAIMAAAFRAIGAHNPDPEFRNPDYLAEKFLRPEDLAMLAANGADYRPALGLRGSELSEYLHHAMGVTSSFVRTRHIDVSMERAAADGARQVVALGAGLDSRAYRFSDRLRGVAFFEVDFPPTQEYKKLRVRAALGKLPDGVRYVPMDFTKDDLLTRLTAGGYDDRQMTFFIWEGVVHYIPESAVRGTLRFVAAHSAPGSRIIFDYPLDTNGRLNNPDNIFSRWGEPFLFGFPNGGPSGFIRDAGLETLSDLTNEELVKMYAMRPDGTSSLRLPGADPRREADDAGIAIAQVPGK